MERGISPPLHDDGFSTQPFIAARVSDNIPPRTSVQHYKRSQRQNKDQHESQRTHICVFGFCSVSTGINLLYQFVGVATGILPAFAALAWRLIVAVNYNIKQFPEVHSFGGR